MEGRSQRKSKSVLLAMRILRSSKSRIYFLASLYAQPAHQSRCEIRHYLIPPKEDSKMKSYVTPKPIKAWWFCKERLLPHKDSRKVKIGSTHVHKGELIICNSGFHASIQILDALKYIQGNILYRVECSGEIIQQSDKLVCSRRKYLASFDATDMLWHFARLCALDVVHLWNAPEIVKRYLRTGDKSIRAAARNATFEAPCLSAQDAAWNAAGYTPYNAARNAARAARSTVSDSIGTQSAAYDSGVAESVAWDAIWDKQRKRLHRMAMRALKGRRKTNSISIKTDS